MTPRLSVLVIAFNGAPLLERCLKSLESQTEREGVEIVAVGTWKAQQDEYAPLQPRFPFVRWIAAPATYNVPQLRSLGMVESTGEIIALLEDDCVVDKSWCSLILAAHRGDAAAIGGAVEPDQFGNRLDWATFFCEYGRFMGPLPNGATVALPGTNVSYKRQALADGGYLPAPASAVLDRVPGGGQLEGFYETFVHESLSRAGVPLRLDSTLAVRNVHHWRPAAALATRFYHGRGFAGLRVKEYSWRVRVPYVGIALLLPVVQVGRLARLVVARRRHILPFLGALPWVILLCLSWSLGELVGYLRGPGASLQRWS